MSEIKEFCAEFGIPESAARAALSREFEEETSALAMPWYVRLVTGIGAWVTAMAAIALGAAILYVALELTSAWGLAVLGAAYLALGLWLLRGEGSHVFITQLGIAVAAAGVAMITVGVRFGSEQAWLGAIASVLLVALVIAGTRNRTLQFLAALLAGWQFTSALVVENVPYFLDVSALAGLAGVYLMLRPPQRDIQPTAVVLLLTFPVFSIFGVFQMGYFVETPQMGGWFAKALHVGLFLWLVAIHWQRAVAATTRSSLGVFALAAVVVCILLPAGGSAALVIMMLAFVLGSRPLALLGSLLQIYFISHFYYDMDVTLLVKSEILTGVGIVLLLVWWLMSRHSPEGRRL